MLRTHTCGELSKSDVGQKVRLCGWVKSRRDHGGLIFVDLRDRYGLTQIVFDPQRSPDFFELGEKIRSEFVLSISGEVIARPDSMVNPKMTTGEIEVEVHNAEIMSFSETPPFELDQDKNFNEEIRLKYRFLDLRRERMQKNIIMRHKVVKHMRDFLDKEAFLEIETPMLIKGTPEGSREYIVPSRIYPGNFYVLPQSPQQLKQLLMVSGFDRYFQIARCFRDEDLRGDRQPEFTQLDMEMSFVDAEDLIQLNERLAINLIKNFASGKILKDEVFPRFTWDEAMLRFGSDKPDIRFDLELKEISELVKDCDFKVFSAPAKNKDGVVMALKVPGGGKFSRKDLSELEDLAKIYEAKGLAYLFVDEDGAYRSPILKFLGEDLAGDIATFVGANAGDVILFSADKFEIACNSLGQVRVECAKRLELIDENLLAFCWVYDFPMFEVNDQGQLAAAHHPFTMIKNEDLDKLESNPLEVRSEAYDLALNGYEIGGGSIRIHDRELQRRVFRVLKMNEEEIESRFGHILNAFDYGVPPHGGIAWGVDRFLMVLCDEPNIREVIAFPKDQKAKDLMLGAPSEYNDEQIAEMHVKIVR
jgi:aspartyl-tRNA synthetase